MCRMYNLPGAWTTAGINGSEIAGGDGRAEFIMSVLTDKSLNLKSRNTTDVKNVLFGYGQRCCNL